MYLKPLGSFLMDTLPDCRPRSVWRQEFVLFWQSTQEIRKQVFMGQSEDHFFRTLLFFIIICLLNLIFWKCVTPGCNYIVGETVVYIYLVLWFNNFKHQKLERKEAMTKWVSFGCRRHRCCDTNEQPERWIFQGLMQWWKVYRLFSSLEGSGLVYKYGKFAIHKLGNPFGKQESTWQKECCS